MREGSLDPGLSPPHQLQYFLFSIWQNILEIYEYLTNLEAHNYMMCHYEPMQKSRVCSDKSIQIYYFVCIHLKFNGANIVAHIVQRRMICFPLSFVVSSFYMLFKCNIRKIIFSRLPISLKFAVFLLLLRQKKLHVQCACIACATEVCKINHTQWTNCIWPCFYLFHS